MPKTTESRTEKFYVKFVLNHEAEEKEWMAEEVVGSGVIYWTPDILNPDVVRFTEQEKDDDYGYDNVVTVPVTIRYEITIG